MTVTEFLPSHSVEICSPTCGSGYRIGGRLVLTAAHLFTALGSCQVRSKGTGSRFKGAFEEVEATVVWMAPEKIDVALVELPVGMENCDPVQFGLLPDDQTGNSIEFQFYGYPKWGSTVTSGGRGSGGRQVKGEIRLSETSFEKLMVLRSENGSDNTSDGSSPWGGASGAAIVCQGCVVAVQSQHQNAKMFTALEAEPLAKIYECKAWCDLLEKHGISSKPKQIKLPKPRVKRSPSTSVKSSSRSPKNKAAELFWTLDYKKQERYFDDQLETLKSCDAFSVVAPCAMTQRWLLNRLIKAIPNHESALRIHPINLSEHLMRFDFELFWNDLAKQVKPQAAKDEILRSLCHSQVKDPIILTIYGFHGPTQKKIIQEFWEPLTEMMHQNSRRSGRSKVVLFLVDQCRPNYPSKAVFELAPFDELLQRDVKLWFESDPVAKWCKKQKLGDRFADDWIENTVSKEDWENPSLIFNQLCTQFQLEHDGMDIQDVWKWAS